MSPNTWTPPAVSSEARPWSARVWRIVEAQHIAATMKLVDDAAEQDILEALLEGSKPHPPADPRRLDYLLASPFRYAPPPGGSRFRGETDSGVFYGAESVRTACAELGYWRWRFLSDAVELKRLEPVLHTAFCVRISCLAVDLRSAPFAVDAAAWSSPGDYRATQYLARAVREAAVGGIVYQSVRDPQPAWCVAVLTPGAFARPKPEPVVQSWWISVQAEGVIWRRDSESLEFAADFWRY